MATKNRNDLEEKLRDLVYDFDVQGISPIFSVLKQLEYDSRSVEYVLFHLERKKFVREKLCLELVSQYWRHHSKIFLHGEFLKLSKEKKFKDYNFEYLKPFSNPPVRDIFRFKIGHLGRKCALYLEEGKMLVSARPINGIFLETKVLVDPFLLKKDKGIYTGALLLYQDRSFLSDCAKKLPAFITKEVL